MCTPGSARALEANRFSSPTSARDTTATAQLSSPQLATYFVGAQEHFDARKAAEAKAGEAFNLKQYHDDMLAQGAPPVRFARQLMLDETIE